MSASFIKESVSINSCKIMIEAAEKKANEMGLAVTITIVDESGIKKAYSRMDGAPLISVKASHKKALTAIGFGLPSGTAWFEFIKDDPILREGAHDFDDFILVGGGSPILINNKIAGAIGISGGHYKQDEECVKAALNCL